jgi:hypothetical protein
VGAAVGAGDTLSEEPACETAPEITPDIAPDISPEFDVDDVILLLEVPVLHDVAANAMIDNDIPTAMNRVIWVIMAIQVCRRGLTVFFFSVCCVFSVKYLVDWISLYFIFFS